MNLLRTADALFRRQEELLKKAELSPAQYNVLRILRGAEPQGLACKDIGERMLTRDPDITRLLDRLEKRGLIRRNRNHRDRRVIMTRISGKGLRLLEDLDQPVARLSRQDLKHLPRRQLRQLIRLLEAARQGGP